MKNWNHLVPFVTAAREGSFRKAAAHLGVTPAAVSQNISQFERQLGFALFYRTTREIRLTEEGARLFATLQARVEDLDHALSLAEELRSEPSGTIRLGVVTSFGRQSLVPILTNFRNAYPRINLDILFGYDFPDTEKIDVVVRNGVPMRSNLVFHEVMEMHSILVAAPSYLERRREPQCVGDLASHTQILVDNGNGIVAWRHKAERRSRASSPIVESNDRYVTTPASTDQIVVRGHVDAVQELVLSGAGITMLHDQFVSRALQTAALVRILRHVDFCLGEPSSHKMYVGHRGDDKMTSRERLLVTYLTHSLAHTLAPGGGAAPPGLAGRSFAG